MLQELKKGTTNVSIVIQNALATGANAFYPGACEGGQTNVDATPRGARALA